MLVDFIYYLFMIYVVIQLISTAYGLAVINAVSKVSEIKLKNNGYTLKSKNSLYEFNDGFINVLKGFVPLYYAIVAIKIARDPHPIETKIDEELKKNNYVLKEELNMNELEMQAPIIKIEDDDIYEKYIARKNDNTLYDTHITPEEYIANDVVDDDISISPFTSKPVTFKESEPVKEVTREVVKEVSKVEVTDSDIARAVTKLSNSELVTLDKLINELLKIRTSISSNK